MYRILVADDEGIMLEAFKSVISSTFGDSCITETAKTGRAVTEKAETFHPYYFPLSNSIHVLWRIDHGTLSFP